jgi:diaminopimelate decarboxylase
LVTISGKFWESSDILIKDIKLPIAESGDILAVYSTGAYTYSMASNYNKQPIPAVILANRGKSYVMVKRQSYEDLIRLEMVPKHLEDS